MKNFNLFVFIFLSFSCKQQVQTVERVIQSNDSVQIITIKESDILKDEKGQNIFTLDSYIQLSNDVLIGQIKRLLIEKEKIFILDHTPKIACFDLAGNLLYSIENHGGGPNEYADLNDIALHPATNELFAYDRSKRRITRYNMQTGKFLSAFSTKHVAPYKIAVKNGHFFFDNPDHFNYPEQKEMHYFLFYSANGNNIDAHFLPHDEIAGYDFLFSTFFYNEKEVYYIKPFDNIIYSLETGSIIPHYQIFLPNSLPISKIREKINPAELSRSAYSFGISDIYKTDEFLHFTFSKDGYIVTTLYDLKEDKNLFTGRRPVSDPSEEMPFYNIIEGVYEGKFFTYISPWSIFWNKEEYGFMPSGLEDMTEEDNPVIAFFKVKQF